MTSNNELIEFETDSIDLHLGVCITRDLTRFKPDFMKGTFREKDSDNTTTVGGTLKVTCYRIAYYVLEDGVRRKVDLKIPLNY